MQICLPCCRLVAAGNFWRSLLVTPKEKVRVIAWSIEGNSLRATTRMTGTHRGAIQKLLVELGAACSAYQDKVFRNLNCKRVQCDEIWPFCYAKDKNVPEEMRNQPGVGSVWTWVEHQRSPASAQANALVG